MADGVRPTRRASGQHSIERATDQAEQHDGFGKHEGCERDDSEVGQRSRHALVFAGETSQVGVPRRRARSAYAHGMVPTRRRLAARAAIYGRVSTSYKVEHQAIERQLRRLMTDVGARAAYGWFVDPAHVFRDDGHSGAMLARPGLDCLRDPVKGPEIDCVLVAAPDRLARNDVH